MTRNALRLGEHGHIARTRQPDGRWSATCRTRDHDGMTRKVAALGRTAAEAERRLRAALADRPRRLADATLAPSVTVTEVLRLYLQECGQRDDLHAATIRTYTTAVRLHLQPRLGSLRLHEITTPRILAVLRAVTAEVGPAAADNARTVLTNALQLAVDRGALAVNPARQAGRTSGRRKPREVQALDPLAVRRLRAALLADPVAVTGGIADALDVLAGTGIRIGELLALRWAEVDLGAEVPTLAVTGTVVEVPQLHRQSVAKSDGSVRRVQLAPFVVEVLERRHLEAATGSGPVGPISDPLGYVFASASGSLRDPANFRRAWRRAMVRTGIPGAEEITRHTLRRSAASVVAAADGGDLVAASKILGHADTRITGRSYVKEPPLTPDRRAALQELAG